VLLVGAGVVGVVARMVVGAVVLVVVRGIVQCVIEVASCWCWELKVIRPKLSPMSAPRIVTG